MTNKIIVNRLLNHVMEFIKELEEDKYVGNDIGFALATGEALASFKMLNQMLVDGAPFPYQWNNSWVEY